MLRHDKLDKDRACLLVVDMQEKLLPLIARHDRIIEATCRMLHGAKLFGIPVLATEQYPKGIGPTCKAIAQCLQDVQALIVEKPTFSACGHTPVRDALERIDRPQVILVGIEAHVCVLQTALDLNTMDDDVFVCADAVGSRGVLDCEHALARMRQDGVKVTTVESALFELCERCDASEFKAMIELVKRGAPFDS